MLLRKSWLVAGASHGLGLAAVKYLLARNQIVIAVAGTAENFSTEMITNPLLEIMVLNAEIEADILQMSEHIAAKYGWIDKLVNNAGATQFMIRQLLPLIRSNGQLIDLLPGCGPVSVADCTCEHASHYAGILSEEACIQANDLGIKVTIIG